MLRFIDDVRQVATAAVGAAFIAGCGGSDSPPPPPPAPVMSLFAGDIVAGGSRDGTGADARFGWPVGATHDASGNLYFADADNSVIRKITPDGVVTTYAGKPGMSGFADAFRTAATFSSPFGLTIDAAGNLYVADTGNSAIRKISADGNVTTIAGVARQTGIADGVGQAARFTFPYTITLCPNGDFFIADAGNATVRRMTPDLNVTTFAGLASHHGTADGNGTAARFDEPTGIVCAAGGVLYVVETLSSTVRKITPQRDVVTLAGLAGATGTSDGVGNAARFFTPWMIDIGPSGNLYVADLDGPTLRKVTPTGTVTTVVGTPVRGQFTPGALPGVIGRPGGLTFVGDTLYFGSGRGIVKVTNMP